MKLLFTLQTVTESPLSLCTIRYYGRGGNAWCVGMLSKRDVLLELQNMFVVGKELTVQAL